MLNSNRIAVVIPIYKSRLNRFEEIALTQCERILGAHTRILAKPRHLDVAAFASRWNINAVESFSDDFFRSVADYCRLMLSREFYDRFTPYTYILIYQLDAFVFRDELQAWCDKGYDYIGAPWIHRSAFGGKLRRGRYRVASALAAWTRSEAVSDQLLLSYVNRTGNGGLSLRNPQAFSEVLADPPRALPLYLQPASRHYNEDVFWSLEVNRYWPRLRIPGWREALAFSFENWPQRTYQLTGGQLPFGCHGWDKLVPEFWWPIIRAQGYTF